MVNRACVHIWSKLYLNKNSILCFIYCRNKNFNAYWYLHVLSYVDFHLVLSKIITLVTNIGTVHFDKATKPSILYYITAKLLKKWNLRILQAVIELQDFCSILLTSENQYLISECHHRFMKMSSCKLYIFYMMRTLTKH